MARSLTAAVGGETALVKKVGRWLGLDALSATARRRSECLFDLKRTISLAEKHPASPGTARNAPDRI
jgi:hypothetical protein